MKRFLVFSVAGFGIALTSFPADVKINVRDLPPTVREAMGSHVGGATIVGASKEQQHDGTFTYEVETKQNGRGRDLTFDEKGALIEVEQEIELNQTPVVVRKALQNGAEGGTIGKIESVTSGSKTSYEAVVKLTNGKRKEIAVNADGSSHSED